MHQILAMCRVQVTEVSCHLHYYSNRPALWPIVVGVLKGLSKQYLKYDLTVELLQSRDDGHDHEVFLVGYPRQTLSNRVNNCGDSQLEAAAAVSPCAFTLSPDLFAELHPFHLLLDCNCSVLQRATTAGTWHRCGRASGVLIQSKLSTLALNHEPSLQSNTLIVDHYKTVFFLCGVPIAWHAHCLHMAYTWHTHGIHMAYTWHTHGHGRLPPTALPDPLGLHRRVGMTKHALIES
ncbi:guanylate cyclase [Haematococcus lacustris]|uniref:Guanylate cyclase n=1 Tax=Haematococcus lacustris TaxID=44745 RepID=A0A6A0A0Y9_HAELA|nr:guanylate cyclase [Haematococcus lacustris]